MQKFPRFAIFFQVIVPVRTYLNESQTSADAPATIRYQAKGANPCFDTSPTNAFMTTMATRKDTTKPSAILSHPTAALVIRSPFLISSSAVAPNMVGIARKKLNSAAQKTHGPSTSGYTKPWRG